MPVTLRSDLFFKVFCILLIVWPGFTYILFDIQQMWRASCGWIGTKDIQNDTHACHQLIYARRDDGDYYFGCNSSSPLTPQSRPPKPQRSLRHHSNLYCHVVAFVGMIKVGMKSPLSTSHWGLHV
jgi:hypothetical protein